MKFAAILIILNTAWAAEVYRPFTTDYCTRYPEGTAEQPTLWASCCKTHDLFFWAGGISYHRDVTDMALYTCVKERAGESQARIIYLGVTAGSLSPWKFKGKQWGNAWGNRVRDSRLSPDEIEALQRSLEERSDLSPQEVERFIGILKQRNP